ncbi:Fc.00g085420.m01.CDS01 [Cosmosporella sp. VM-42]
MTVDNRVVPTYLHTGNTGISGLQELHSHLQSLVVDPEAPLEVKLFDDVYLQLTEDNTPPLLDIFLPLLTVVIKTTSQDPGPALELVVKLLSPLSFTQTLQIVDSDSLITALRSSLPGANKLALKILEKAAKSPADAHILSNMPEVVVEMLIRWLESEDAGVGLLANNVLYRLLEVDNPFDNLGPLDEATGLACLWRFVFDDRSNLQLIQSSCQDSDNRTYLQTTVSQGRLLDLLARLVAINPRTVSMTRFSDLFPLPPGVSRPGLLQWAALSMVKHEDVLMYLNLVSWFEKLVSVMRTTNMQSNNTHLWMSSLLQVALEQDSGGYLRDALNTLPDRTVEEEAEPLRAYIKHLLA